MEIKEIKEEKDKLPEGWEWTRHTDISEVNAKPDFSNVNDNIEVSFVPMAAVEEETGKFSLKETRRFGEVKKGYTAFKDGDLIFAKITPCMENGKIAIIKNLKNGIGFGSTEFHTSRFSSLVFTKFYFYFFVQKNFRRESRRHMTGSAGQLRVPSLYFKEIPILLPPLYEQRRIVDIIEELFSNLDKAVESLKTAKEQLKIYRQAVLKFAFEGKLTEEWRHNHKSEPAEKLLKKIKAERQQRYLQKMKDWNKAVKKWESEGKNPRKPPKPPIPKELPPLTKEELAELPELPEGWVWIKFGNIVKSLKRGPFGSTIKKAFFVDSGYKVYEQKNAIYKSEKLGDYFIDEKKFEELFQFEVKDGDYIVSCSGTIGRLFRLPYNAKVGVINQALLRIRIEEHFIDHYFFQCLFESDSFQKKVIKDTKGTAMVNLAGVKELQVVPFPICAFAEQHQIVQEIETRFSVADKLEQTIDESLKKAEALRQSILKKAFEGELTKKWRKQHPELISGKNSAKALLEKIKREKTKQDKQKKKKRK